MRSKNTSKEMWLKSQNSRNCINTHYGHVNSAL